MQESRYDQTAPSSALLANAFHCFPPIAEPSAVELIMQFISMTPDTTIPSTVVTPGSDLQNIAGASVGANATTPAAPAALNVPPIAPQQQQVGLQLTRKQLALKILELKVATWLKWDLDLLEKSLPVLMQLSLLRDLLTISYGRPVSIPLTSDFDMKICKYHTTCGCGCATPLIPFVSCSTQWQRARSTFRTDHLPSHAAATAVVQGQCTEGGTPAHVSGCSTSFLGRCYNLFVLQVSSCRSAATVPGHTHAAFHRISGATVHNGGQ